MIVISHAKLQINVSMFVSGWKWQSGIKDGPALPLLSCESSVSVKKALIQKKKKNLRTRFVLCMWCFEQRHFSSVVLLVGVYRCFSMNVLAYFSNTMCESLDVFCNKGSSGKLKKIHRKRLMLESLFNKIVGCKFQHRGFFLWILREFLEDLFTGKTFMENFWVTASGNDYFDIECFHKRKIVIIR